MTDTIASFLDYWDNCAVFVLCSLDDLPFPFPLSHPCYSLSSPRRICISLKISRLLCYPVIRSFTFLNSCTGLPLRICYQYYIYKRRCLLF